MGWTYQREGKIPCSSTTPIRRYCVLPKASHGIVSMYSGVFVKEGQL